MGVIGLKFHPITARNGPKYRETTERYPWHPVESLFLAKIFAEYSANISARAKSPFGILPYSEP